ncbi:hypothetical protein N9M74_00840 [Pontimonas sp.]|nr:hypothetical protein [Pontimonas sp.]
MRILPSTPLLAVSLAAVLLASSCVSPESYEGPENLSSWCLDNARSDEPLGQRLCSEIPELNSGDYEKLAVIVAVRGWVSEQLHVSVTGGSSTGSPVYGPEDFWNIEPADAFEASSEGEWGLLCGGFAWFLMSVYNFIGLNSFIYNVTPGGWSHVVTLVEYQGEFIVQDAFFDYMVLMDDRPASIEAIIRTTSELRSEELELITGDAQFRSLVSASSVSDALEITGAERCISLESGFYSCSREQSRVLNERSLIFAHKSYLDPFFREYGLPFSFFSIFFFPDGISSTTDGYVTPGEDADSDARKLLDRLVEVISDNSSVTFPRDPA